MKTANCDECLHSHWHATEESIRMECAMEHKPRFYQPRSNDDQNYGYKRKCADFIEVKEET